MRKVDQLLKRWFRLIPKLYICLGNHDRMVDRKSRTVGLPDRVFRSFRDIWNFPKTWITDFEFEFECVRFFHGSGYNGKYAHVQAAYDSRGSAVIGHTHSTGAVQYIDSKGCIFGMNVGCGIDRKKYAFAYGKDFRFKPILGCGVVTDKGNFAQFFPMDKNT